MSTQRSRVQLAAYSPHRPADVLGYLVAFWTDRKPQRRLPSGRPWVSHVELVIDGQCYSSSLRDGGVRAKQIDLNKPHWRLVPVPWADAELALQQFERFKGRPYGYADLLAQHVLRLPVDARGLTCSELVARMLGLPRAERIDPAWLTDYCESRKSEQAEDLA